MLSVTRIREGMDMAASDFYEVLDPRFARLFNGNAQVEKLFTGCLWAEGPAWFGAGRFVVWSDIPNNRMMRYDETSGHVSVFRQPANNSNGNTVDRQGRLVTCEHGGRRVSRTEHDGTVITLADRYRGQAAQFAQRRGGEIGRLDLVHRSRPTASIPTMRATRPKARSAPRNVYRIDPASGAVDGGHHRHGQAERHRLLARREAALCRRHRPHARGAEPGAHARLRRRRGQQGFGRQGIRRCTAGLFDGFRLDTEGRIWTSAGDGIHCYDPDGTLHRQGQGAGGRRQLRLRRRASATCSTFAARPRSTGCG